MNRVLHVLPASPFGGAQRLAIDLAARQRAGRLDAGIFLTNAGETARTEAGAADVPVVWCAQERDGLMDRLRVFRTTVASGRFDILHMHLPPPWLCVGLSLSRPYAVVTHLHIRPPLQVHAATLRRQVEAVALGLSLRRSDMLLAISNWVDDAWRKAYPALQVPSVVVYNGVPVPDAKVLDRAPTEGFVIGVASRLADRKGLEEFIILAERIHRMAPEARFKVAGDGPIRPALEVKTSERGLADVMDFVGFTADVGAFWRGVDLSVFTAPFEPFGLRLIEPIAHGTPVVAYYNRSGSDEVIENCRGTAAVAYGEVDALAEMAVALGRSPARRREMVVAGREDIVRHFSIDAMEKNVREAYDMALTSRFNPKVAQVA